MLKAAGRTPQVAEIPAGKDIASQKTQNDLIFTARGGRGQEKTLFTKTSP